ncbi:hypothetical protein C9374_011324 [Naegleria lovaniensis]|uniref:DDE Tnp4 domain-containing protein n=1 Tax=Naegleria lovaniensis TaxID=51637 RepID=A0AA88H2R8_NAELO|nr:uncharacterized protein C9374_011324 [Naegleria lovaniensis]KAG2392599.1 hypothetical protein C9374_011324 [Naegleria lovaniensis]
MTKSLPVFNERNVEPLPSSHERTLVELVQKKILESVIKKVIKYVQRPSNEIFYGMLTVRQVVLLFLYYITYGDSFIKMEIQFHIPHSNISRAITILRSILYTNIKNEIKFFPLAIRKRAIRRRTRAKWLHKCTVALDSIDIPKAVTEIMKLKNLNKRKEKNTERGELWRSHKLKNHHHALRYHFACDFLYRIGYVSKYRPPTEYDGHGIIRDKTRFENSLEEGDVVMADDHYRTVKRKIKKVGWVCPKRETQKDWNPDTDVKKNKQQRATRKLVETELSQIANNFRVLAIPWKGSVIHHQKMVWIIAAIHNLIVDTQYPNLVE